MMSLQVSDGGVTAHLTSDRGCCDVMTELECDNRSYRDSTERDNGIGSKEY